MNNGIIDSPRHTASTRSATIAIVIVVGCATTAWIVGARRSSLWADEIFSLAMATGHGLEHPAADAIAELGDYVEPPGPVTAETFSAYMELGDLPAGPRRIVRAVLHSDTNPPLYYLLLNGWLRLFGTSDFALRAFSIACAVLCFPLLFMVGRRLGEPTALLATLLFASAPRVAEFATDGRMYPLVWLLSLLLLQATLDLDDHPKRWAIVRWVLAASAGLLTHYFFAFPVVASMAWLLRTAALRRRVAMAAIVVAVLVAAWYVQVPRTLGLWRVTAGWLNGRLSPVGALWSLVVRAGGFLGVNRPWRVPQWNVLALVAVSALAIRLSLAAIRGRVPRQVGLLALWVLASVVGTVVFDVVMGTTTSMVPRYALAALPALFLATSWTLTTLRPVLRGAILVLLAIAWCVGFQGWSSLFRSEEPFHELAASVNERRRPGDLVLVHGIPGSVLGIARYLPANTPIASWIERLGKRRVPDDIARLVKDRSRLILVRISEVFPGYPEEDWLRRNYPVTETTRLNGARVIYFDTSRAAAVDDVDRYLEHK